MKNIVRIKFGSHLYGTNTPESDLDYKSVHIPSAEDILLQRVARSIKVQSREKAEGEKNTRGDVDDESYSLQHFLSLAAEGQTGAIDMLFAPAEMVELGPAGEWWTHILFNRDRLLSKQSVSFVGYCRQQANKYGIKGSRVEAAKRASEFFTSWMNQFGPLVKVGDIPVRWLHGEHSSTIQKETTPGKFETYFECCNRMVGFKNTVKEAANIFTRIYENYGARARLAQSNEGVDWKALSHAVRVGTEAVELLTTGYVTLPLRNAAHVLDIKQGRLAYQEVSEEIEQLLVDVESAAETSKLPEQPDQEWIKAIVLDVYEEMVIEGEES